MSLWPIDCLPSCARRLLSTLPDLKNSFDERLSQNERPCSKWFGHCLASSVSLRLIESREGTDAIVLIHADVRLEIDENKPDSQPEQPLQNEIDADIRFMVSRNGKEFHMMQFGGEVGVQQNSFECDKDLHGLLFALHTPRVVSSLDLKHFAKLIGFFLPFGELFSVLLSSIKLSLCDKSHSGLWFLSKFSYHTIVRVAMELSERRDGMKTLMRKGLDNMGLGSSDMIFIRTRVSEISGSDNSESSMQLGLKPKIELGQGTKSSPKFEGNAGI